MKELMEMADNVRTILADMESVKNELKELIEKTEPKRTGAELPIDIKRAGELLNLAEQTIYGKTSKGTIPHIKKGGKIYFYESQLLHWLESQ